MSWWVWAIIIFVSLVILSSIFSEGEKAASKNKSKNSANQKTPQEIAQEITTVGQFRALERKLERADENRQRSQAHDSRSEKSEARADAKYQLIQEAYDIAMNKVLRWQFIPNATLETPLNLAKIAYQTFTLAEYEEKILEFGDKKEEWYGIQGDGEPDEKDDDIKFIVKFRRIIENPELSEEEKDKKVNALVARDREVASNFFDVDGKRKPSEQWRETDA